MKLLCIVLSTFVLFKCATAAWTGFETLGGGFNHVASSSWGPGRMNVFGAANNGQVYYKSYSRGAWSDWNNLGGDTQLRPTAFSIKPNWVDVVYTGTDRLLYRKTWNGYAWNNWSRATNGGVFISGPTITASPGDTTNLHMFGVSTDSTLYHCVVDVTSDKSSYWENLGGSLVGDPAAVSWGSNRFDVFSVGYDNQLWQKTYDNGWMEWKVLYGGQYKLGVGVVSKGLGSISVFGVGHDNAIYQRSYGNGRWYETESVRYAGHAEHAERRIRGIPSAVSTGSTRVDLFATDETDGAVYHSYSDTKSDDDPSNYGCYRGFCWTNCNATVDEWCYTTKGYSHDFKYVSCEGLDNCENNWKCAGSCLV